MAAIRVTSWNSSMPEKAASFVANLKNHMPGTVDYVGRRQDLVEDPGAACLPAEICG